MHDMIKASLSLSIQEARRALFCCIFPPRHGHHHHHTIKPKLELSTLHGDQLFFWLFGKFVFFSTAAGACPPANPYITIYISSFLVSLCFLALHFFFYYSYTTCEKYKCSGGGDDGRGKTIVLFLCILMYELRCERWKIARVSFYSFSL